MSIRWIACWTAATVLPLSCSTLRERETDSHSVEPSEVAEAISASWKEHIAAAMRGDVQAVVAMYSDDVHYIIPGVQEVRGRPEIEAMEAQSFATMEVLDATHTIDALHVFGDVAYEVGTVIGPVRPRGGEARLVTFHFMAMWQREADDQWRMKNLVGQ